MPSSLTVNCGWKKAVSFRLVLAVTLLKSTSAPFSFADSPSELPAVLLAEASTLSSTESKRGSYPDIHPPLYIASGFDNIQDIPDRI